ncbi:MAG: DUF1566 domain-containing protein, partial [Gammaproteobacteria bacterium]|nr:DUF1566 domain-containing protein [Gammaproteobacteria bacterium]
GSPAPSTTPTGIIATTGNGSVNLSWHQVPGADKYNIYYSSNPNTPLLSASKLSSNTLDIQITGLTNNTKYYFVITAVQTTDNIESEPSTQIESMPISEPVLANLPDQSLYHGESTTLTFTNTGGIAISCTASPTLPTGLNIAVHSGTCHITGTATGLVTATNYTIKATNTTGFNSATVNISVVLKAPTATVVAGDKKVTLSWNSVSGADKYNIYYATETFTNINDPSNYASLTGGTLIPNLTETNKEITLINGIRYYFVLTALKGDEESGANNEINAVPTTIPIPTVLNDTGITWGGNYPSGNNTNCTGTTITAQDCQHGRDAKATAGRLTKIGAGSAGFDFTKLDSDGNTLSPSATDWRCVKDNHTGLVWEVKTISNLHNKNNWYNAQVFVNRVNTAGLCGKYDWRLPDRNELHSIVDYGRYNPSIDTGYFPNTSPGYFWSSSPRSSYSYGAWVVSFGNGYAYDDYRGYNYRVRLVRSGQ